MKCKIQTELVEFVANNIMYAVQTTNLIQKRGTTAVHISTRPSDHRMNNIKLEDDAEAGGWKVRSVSGYFTIMVQIKKKD